jgi:hypothetical protein
MVPPRKTLQHLLCQLNHQTGFDLKGKPTSIFAHGLIGQYQWLSLCSSARNRQLTVACGISDTAGMLAVFFMH